MVIVTPIKKNEPKHEMSKFISWGVHLFIFRVDEIDIGPPVKNYFSNRKSNLSNQSTRYRIMHGHMQNMYA